MLSCSDFAISCSPVLAGLILCCSVLPVLYRLFLSKLSCPDCFVLAILYSTFCPVLAVLSQLSCPIAFSWLSCPGGLIPVVLSRCLVPAVLLAVLSRLFCLTCLVLSILSRMSCPGCLDPTVLSQLTFQTVVSLLLPL